jgi:hypothetical protein
MHRFVLVAALALVPAVARSDSAAPRGYQIAVEGTSLVICADPYFGSVGFPGRPCPDQGLLRRNVTTGDMVLVSTCNETRCFLDECVPPGTYQYGLAVPFGCSAMSSATYYYVVQVVTAPVQACIRIQPAPTPHSSGVPWGSCQYVCQYRGEAGCPSESGGCSTVGGVLTFDMAAFLAGVLLWARRARRTKVES